MAMTSHTTWRECLPNTFPPVSASRQHALNSRFSPDFLAADDQLDITLDGQKYGGDDEDLPTMRSHHSAPLLNEDLPTTRQPHSVRLHSSTLKSINDFLDPTLCVTPEKAAQRRTCLKGGRETRTGEASLERSTPKVTFDSTVEVKQMSPEYCPEDVSVEAPSAPTSLLDTDTSLSEILSNRLSFDEIMTTQPNHEVNCEPNDNTEASKPAIPESSNKDYDIEPISVIASDMQNFPALLNGKQGKKRSRVKLPKPSTSVAELTESDVAVSQTDNQSRAKFTQLKSNIAGENVFNRPEFNSTLRIRRDVQKLEGEELDLTEAVKTKLETSDQTRNKLDEKAYKKLNVADLEHQQFRSLVAVDVRQEELLQQVVSEEIAKVRPARSDRLPQELRSRAPDSMDFFTADLQWESASYNVDGLIPPTSPQLLTAQLTHSFDVYRHIRSWEKW